MRRLIIYVVIWGLVGVAEFRIGHWYGYLSGVHEACKIFKEKK